MFIIRTIWTRSNVVNIIFKEKPIVYDSHEYFLGVPEIQNRFIVKKVWTSIEQFIFPKLQYVFTVNNSIADLYFQDYNSRPNVIRNLPTVSSNPKRIKKSFRASRK